MYLLGIDIGTTKIAGVLLFHNTFVKVLSENNDSALPSIHSWEHLQDPHIILKTAFKIIDQLKREINEPVTSIGISGQMHGFLYVTKEGNACSPLFTWQDSRAAIPLEQDSPVTAQSFIQERTGHHIFPGYALATHYYNHYKKLVPENAYGIVSIGGYLAMKLSRSAEACIDPSEAASFGLYDIKEQTFVFREIERLYGNIDFLPKLVPFHHRAGFLKDGTPVFSSLGDNQASFYGCDARAAECESIIEFGN